MLQHGREQRCVLERSMRAVVLIEGKWKGRGVLLPAEKSAFSRLRWYFDKWQKE
jgi:hypothetical protein